VFSMERALVWKVNNTFLEFYDGIERAGSSSCNRSSSLDTCRDAMRQGAIKTERLFSEPVLSSTQNVLVAASKSDSDNTDSSQNLKASSQAVEVSVVGKKRVHRWRPRRFRSQRESASGPPEVQASQCLWDPRTIGAIKLGPPVMQTTQGNQPPQEEQQHLHFQQQALGQQSEQFNKECSHDQRYASKVHQSQSPAWGDVMDSGNQLLFSWISFARSLFQEAFPKKRLAKQFAFDSVFLWSINFVVIESVLASMQVHHTMCWLRAISNAWKQQPNVRAELAKRVLFGFASHAFSSCKRALYPHWVSFSTVMPSHPVLVRYIHIWAPTAFPPVRFIHIG